jgi:hypothetical protein
VTTPSVVIRPMWPSPNCSVNQRLPSGPAVMEVRRASGPMPALNSVTVPSGVIRPMVLFGDSVNQTLPSGPAVMPSTLPPALMPAPNMVMAPSGVMRPTCLPR